jgi:hypothetical protein
MAYPEPNYGMAPFHCGSLKTMVAVGSFVQTEDSSIGKILDHRTSANADQEVLLNLFILMSESSIRYRTQPVASGRGRHVREVIQSLIKTWVPANSCRRPAFIFTNSDLENGNLCAVTGCKIPFCYVLGVILAHLRRIFLSQTYTTIIQ